MYVYVRAYAQTHTHTCIEHETKPPTNTSANCVALFANSIVLVLLAFAFLFCFVLFFVLHFICSLCKKDLTCHY